MWLLDAALGRAVRIGRGERGSVVLCTGGAEAPEVWVEENEWRLAVKLESKPGRVVVEAYVPFAQSVASCIELYRFASATDGFIAALHPLHPAYGSRAPLGEEEVHVQSPPRQAHRVHP
ncbi:MAG: hypothetical protein DRJ96_05905 [Thermoprotei archaeon]|nr:MAG: hypothetical protein DRJ96_05905 [Thermoprotei archaeon]